MIRRTLEISQQPVHLTVKDRQLLLLPRGEDAEPLARVPCEDVGVLLVEHPGCTFSHAALVTLLECDAAVVVCGRDHLPAGLLLPFSHNTEVVWRLHDQIAMPRPLRKRLWTQLVQAKIRAQAANLAPEAPARSRLVALARSVRSGDPQNVEAQAARAYWAALFDGPGFRRDADRPDVNAWLNYGYAVLRAAVARALVSAGLLPALGIHHSNRSNAFCLADDLMEPLRPLVDARVRGLAGVSPCRDAPLTPETKRALLELLTAEVRCGESAGPLMVALPRYVASLVRCLTGEAQRLTIPTALAHAAAERSLPTNAADSASRTAGDEP